MKRDTYNSLERQIRIKIGIIVFIVLLYFLGLFVFSNRARVEISYQKKEIDFARELVSINDQLILSVQHAQEILNNYLISPRKEWQNEYDSLTTLIQKQMMAVNQLTTDDESKVLLKGVDSLLHEKELIGKRLITLIRSQNPITTLDSKIETYDEIIRDTVVVTTSQDTVRTFERSRQSFWGRLKNLFDPSHNTDSTITIAHTQQETWSSSRIDTMVYSDLKQITREASDNYTTRMGSIEKQVRELIFAEQNISLRISQLITQYYHEAMEKSKEGVDNSESLTQRIFTFALSVGIISLFMILLVVLMIVNDLNKGQRARRDLIKEKQRSEQLIDSRHKLLLSVSHDIKTPLSSMMGYMEMWDNNELTPEKKNELQSVRNSARHILSMLSNLLEFSRIERNQGVLHITNFELYTLMEEILSMFYPLMEEKGLELKYENHLPDPFIVESDQTILKQILVNIISNSVKYTYEGKVSVELNNKAKHTTFTISDTGIGIDKAELGEIFKPFYRVGDISRSEGSGFGLYVTQGLVHALKGEITLTSEKGMGTQVMISLPLNSVERATSLKDKVYSSSEKVIVEKILVFEDDPSLGKMLREYLTRQGCKVKLCSDPRDAYGFARVVSSFDIVITDLQMSETSGNEILQAIREKDTQIPVWLMTAHDDYTWERALDEGFTGLLSKPVKLETLMTIISGNSNRVKNKLTRDDDPFPGLTALFGDDKEAIHEILLEFVESAEKDMNTLSELIKTHSFAEAQQLCHRIHPFYSQLGADDLIVNFRKMDTLRNQEEVWPEWEEKLRTTVKQVRELITTIKQNHL